MPTKSFSIYKSYEEDATHTNNRLVLEVGAAHIACIHQQEDERAFSAFELFTYSQGEATDFKKLFATITADSKLLHKEYSATNIFLNNEFSTLVPLSQFTPEMAAECLDLIFGENPLSNLHFERLTIEPHMINVYRGEAEVSDILNNNLSKVTFSHTYSNIIRTIFSNISAFASDFIYIQFYNTSIIAAVIKNMKLQLIQCFPYETPEDVLYQLLNIAARFELKNNQLTLFISGMIDLHSNLYKELIAYFNKVEVQDTELTLLPGIKEYPLHYFTPFFNLAL